MPSKNYNGQNPLGEKRSQSFAQVELQVGRLQPAISLQSGSLQTPNGRIPSQKFVPTGTGAAVSCQLGKMLVDSVNSTPTATKFKISPGFLTGGGSTETIQPDNLDAIIDEYVYISVAWTASTVNGVLQAGGTMGSVSVLQGATIPDDTLPTAATPAGTANIALGRWLSDGAGTPSPRWVYQGCGSIQIYFCPGNGFFYGRANEVQSFL